MPTTVATPAPPQTPGFTPAPGVVTPATQQTDGKATASLILGVLSLTMFWIFAGIPAIILGHTSRSNIRKSMGKLKGEGMALAGLIMGYLSIATLPIILIIAAIAIPNLLRARTAANESAAVASVRTIIAAATTYNSEYGKGFPATLEQMAPPATGQERSADRADLIDNFLANGQKSGYRFEYTATAAEPGANVPPPPPGFELEYSGFFVRAVPVNAGNTGIRSFCADETGIIRYARMNEECTADSPVLQ